MKRMNINEYGQDEEQMDVDELNEIVLVQVMKDSK